MNCQRCGLPIFDGAYSYSGPVCRCFAGRIEFAPNPPDAKPGNSPFRMVSEADVRRIVAEEIAKAFAIHMQGESAREALRTQPGGTQEGD